MKIEGRSDKDYMKLALEEAKFALEHGDIPVGAVVVCGDKIIGRAHNQVELLNDATAHAEMLAITSASSYLGSRYLNECTLYVTLEPCAMCAGALSWAQLGKLFYATEDKKRGYKQFNSKILHPKTKVASGLLEEECKNILLNFFKSLRK